mgnify:CR=1 FL=1
MNNIFKITYLIIFLLAGTFQVNAEEKVDLLKTDWSFKGLFGKFDRVSLQRGYQVYTEVCASCHSMKYVSYRNLFEPGGPEFTEDHESGLRSDRGPVVLCDFSKLRFWKSPYDFLNLYGRFCPYNPPYKPGKKISTPPFSRR